MSRMIVDRNDTKQLACFIAYWEQFAASFADRMLTGELTAEFTTPQHEHVNVNINNCEREYVSVAASSWIAFLEGWGGIEQCSVWEPFVIFEAGRLARRIYEDRETTMTRIYEYLAMVRTWKTDIEICKALDLVDSYQARYLGRQLVAGGFLELKPITSRKVVPARMAFRRVPPQRRS